MPQRTDSWYTDWFDEDYLALYAHRDMSEARRFVDRLRTAAYLEPGDWVADIPCGAGRHALAFAEHGVRVVGIDLSRVMLHRALQDRPQDTPPFFIRSDIRRVPLAACFKLVTNIFTSIGYFEDESGNRAAFSELCRLLVPGGVLVIDIINAAYLRNHFVPVTRRELPTGTVQEHRSIDEARHRVLKRITIQRGHFERVIYESVRFYPQSELTRMAEANGLEPFHFWGDYSGEAFTAESPRLIMLARKR